MRSAWGPIYRVGVLMVKRLSDWGRVIWPGMIRRRGGGAGKAGGEVAAARVSGMCGARGKHHGDQFGRKPGARGSTWTAMWRSRAASPAGRRRTGAGGEEREKTEFWAFL